MKYIMRIKLFIIATALLFIPQISFAYRVPDRDHWRIYTLYLINQSRADYHLPPLGIRDNLNELSQAHAEDSALHFDDSTMESRRATYLEHVSFDRRTLKDRVEELGINDAIRFGENVGFRWAIPFGNTSLVVEDAIRSMHEGMMAEVPPHDGHKLTILGDFTHVGVGLELQREAGSNVNTIFFVTDFGKFHEFAQKIIPDFIPRPIRKGADQTQKNTESVPVDAERRRRIRVRKTEKGVRVVITQDTAETDETAPKTASWRERSQERVERRRSERLERLLNRVQERREKRMQRKGFLM